MKANKRTRELIEDDRGMIQMLPAVGIAVVMLYAIMYIGTYINGTVGAQLIDSYPSASGRSDFQNRTISTLTNLSGDYDSNVEIVSIAAIISVLTIPLMAVVAIKRLI